MPRHFLRGFNEDGILADLTLDTVRMDGYRHALNLAMLGLANEAHAIFTLLNDHNVTLRNGTDRMAIDLFYHASDLTSPFAIDADSLKDVKEIQLAGLADNNRRMSYGTWTYNHELNMREPTEQSYRQLSGYAVMLAGENGSEELLSAALVALLYMANELDKQTDVQHIMTTLAAQENRYDGWTDYFPIVYVAWEKMFLPGGLREVLDLQTPEVEEYAKYVLQTLKKRFENGPLHHDTVYAGKSIRELLQDLDRFTMEDPEYDPLEYWTEEELVNVPTTIFQDPATNEEITEAEERIGRPLPDDVKEFLKVSNGCSEMRYYAGSRMKRLMSTEEIFFEDEDYMADYTLSLLGDFEVQTVDEGANGQNDASKEADGSSQKQPLTSDDVDLNFEWLTISGGAIAMYEHEGQGTLYTWILPKTVIDAGKKRIEEVYNKVSAKQKQRIDEAIVEYYGSRQVYDGMEYGINIQHWGQPEGQRVFPNFMSFLRSLVYQTRPAVERSPLQIDTRQQ